MDPLERGVAVCGTRCKSLLFWQYNEVVEGISFREKKQQEYLQKHTPAVQSPNCTRSFHSFRL